MSIQSEIYNVLAGVLPGFVWPVTIEVPEGGFGNQPVIRYSTKSTTPKETIASPSSSPESVFEVDVLCRDYIALWNLQPSLRDAVDLIPGIAWNDLGSDLPWEADPKMYRLHMEFSIQR